MNKKNTIQVFLVLFVASIVLLPTATATEDPTSSRTMPTSVNTGAELIINIAVADYGSFGTVVETIPDGFMYVKSSLGVQQAEDAGNTVTFTLLGETSFDYIVITPSNSGTYTFSGIIKDDDANEFTIGGDTSVILVNAEQVIDSPPDEQTSTTNIPTTQIDSESVDSETIDEIPDESVESDTFVDDVNNESSKSVKTTPSTESTEEIPAPESSPFIATFGMIVIGVIATLVYKLKK